MMCFRENVGDNQITLWHHSYRNDSIGSKREAL